ncbi:MAG: AMMECR1 domain-containing protein [Myxococcota bacterium]
MSASEFIEISPRLERALLDYAIEMARTTLSGEPEPLAPDCGGLEAGAFVALRCGGEPRGFLGTLRRRPLHEAVASAARLAAVGDPRYETGSECVDAKVELWLAGPTRPIDGPGDMREDDGVVVRSGFNRAVHLPGVAGIGEGPDGVLASACVAADLHPRAWQQEEVECLAFPTRRVGHESDEASC